MFYDINQNTYKTSSITLSHYIHYVKKQGQKRGHFLQKELAPIDTKTDTENMKVG